VIDHIVTTLDGSEYAERALVHTRDLALATGARVSLLAVLPRIGESDAAREQRCQAYLRDRTHELIEGGVSAATANVLFGDPADSISRFASTERADVLVMATRGLGADDRNVVGSVALRVLTTAPCPVFMVRIEPVAPPKSPAEERWQQEGGANVG
jgi:nucleotide-binding universal stress UspA family protein